MLDVSTSKIKGLRGTGGLTVADNAEYLTIAGPSLAAYAPLQNPIFSGTVKIPPQVLIQF